MTPDHKEKEKTTNAPRKHRRWQSNRGIFKQRDNLRF